MKFAKVDPNVFSQLQVEAGVLLNTFSPATPSAPEASAIICATSGGIKADCVPSFTDFGEDIDNVPNNTKELKRLDGYECTFAFTALNVTTDIIKMALGAADIGTTDTTKVTPRAELEQTDFSDVWWVGDLTDGGMVAIKLKNALSTGGLSLQTTKKGKGQLSVTLTGHISIEHTDEIPMEFYVAAA
jgi:hypothetical protein